MWHDLPLILAQEDGSGGSQPPALPGGGIEGGSETSTTTPGTTPDTTGNGTDQGGDNSFPLGMILVLVFGVMLIFMMGGGRKEKKKRAAMLAAMSKGDRVQSIGGILGTVLEIKENEVVVKVDENANTRLHFAKSAIQSVVESKDS